MLPVVPPISGLTHHDAKIRYDASAVRWRRWHYFRDYAVICGRILFTPLNLIILGLGVTLSVLGRDLDAFATMIVVTINVVMSMVQSTRARMMLQQIANAALPTISVWRSDGLHAVHPQTVVAGDVILVRPGDQIVADGRILVADSVAFDESRLTGENEPIVRMAGDELVAGAWCVNGAAWYQVTIATNQGTMAQIIAGAQIPRNIVTPLMTDINRVLQVMVMIASGLMVVVVFRDYYLQVPLVELIAHLTVMAGLIPNALVLTLTVSLALAAVYMSRSGGLVQQTAAVDAMCQVDTLCFDKTGTLTANQLQVTALRVMHGDETTFRQQLGAYVHADVAGNRTTQVIAMAISANPATVIQAVSFDAVRKWSAQQHADGVFLLGAPDVLRPALAAQWRDIDLASDAVHAGARVLLFARADAFAPDFDNENPTLPSAITPLGLVIMQDTIRPEAREVLDAFRALGVRIVIISGDDPQAVAALMTQVGFVASQQVVHGREIDALADDALATLVAKVAIFGRVTPPQKARIITALRQNGASPAMVGDGMNDVLAMKQSTLALAMQTSNSAVRAVADVVLLNDNLAVLPALLHAGQRVISSMQAVLNHFLVRVSLSTVLLLTGMLLGKIIWLPADSAFLALGGVVIPALVIVSRSTTPASLRDRARMWRDAGWLCGIGVVVVVITHFFFAHAQAQILVGFAIMGLWIRLLRAYKSPA